MNTRKGLAYLLIGLLTFTTSCSDDDDSVGDVVDELIEDGEEIVDGAVDEGGEIIEGGEEIIDETIGGGEDEVEEPTSVVINEIRHLGTDSIEIYNPTSEAIDISDYWLCLGSGTYRQFSDENSGLMLEGSTVIESGGFLVITGYNLPDESAGLGLYRDVEGDFSNFGNSDFIIDFVQYGAEGSESSQRENVAVAAELWVEGTFVPLVGSDNVNDNGTLIYSGSGVGFESWSETTEATFGRENVPVAP